jgi:hypothetical protein
MVGEVIDLVNFVEMLSRLTCHWPLTMTWTVCGEDMVIEKEKVPEVDRGTGVPESRYQDADLFPNPFALPKAPWPE